MSCLDGTGPVELLHEDETGHLVGKGQSRQGQDQVGPFKDSLVQAKVSADEKEDLPDTTILPRVQQERQGPGIRLPAGAVQGHGHGAGRHGGKELLRVLEPDSFIGTTVAMLFPEHLQLDPDVAGQSVGIVPDTGIQVLFPGLAEKEKDKLHLEGT